MPESENIRIDLLKEHSIEVRRDETLLEGILRAGIPHYHVCGGMGKCSTCRVLVVEGAENLSEPNETELELRSKMGFSGNVRLACQTYALREPVKLNRIVRDLSDLDIYLDPSYNELHRQIGEERKMALMFLDIRNFTPFMEKHLAFDVIHIISKLFHIFQTTINSHNGKIIETAGDGLYAVFGMDNPDENFSEQAVKAGHALLKDIEVFNRKYLQPYFTHRFEIGIGLHSGNVIYGSLNRDMPSHMVVMGFAVNIAARLQNSTKQLNNSFVISEHIVRELDEDLERHPKTHVNLKGISDPLKVYLIGKPYSEIPVQQ